MEIVQMMNLDRREVQFGKRKVFIRSPETVKKNSINFDEKRNIFLSLSEGSFAWWNEESKIRLSRSCHSTSDETFLRIETSLSASRERWENDKDSHRREQKMILSVGNNFRFERKVFVNNKDELVHRRSDEINRKIDHKKKSCEVFRTTENYFRSRTWFWFSIFCSKKKNWVHTELIRAEKLITIRKSWTTDDWILKSQKKLFFFHGQRVVRANN